jgi:hypothetical protein
MGWWHRVVLFATTSVVKAVEKPGWMWLLEEANHGLLESVLSLLEERDYVQWNVYGGLGIVREVVHVGVVAAWWGYINE